MRHYQPSPLSKNHPEALDLTYLINDVGDVPTIDSTAGQPKGFMLDWSKGALLGGYFTTSHHAKNNRRLGFHPFMSSYYSIFWGWSQKAIVGVAPKHTLTANATTATDGTFTITVNGATTSALDHDATAATIQAALHALATVGTNGVVATDSGGGLAANNGVCTLVWWDPRGYTVTANFTGITGNPHVLAVSVAAGTQQDTKSSAQIGYQCVNRNWMNGVFGYNNVVLSARSIVAGQENVVGCGVDTHRKRVITAYRTPAVSAPNGEIDVATDVTAEFPPGTVVVIRGRIIDDGNAPDTCVSYVKTSTFGSVTTIALGMPTPWDINADATCWIMNAAAGGETSNAVFGNSNSVYASHDLVAGKDNVVTGHYDLVSGLSHTVSGSYCLAAGTSHTVSGTAATALGSACTASGSYSAAIGLQNQATAAQSVAIGTRALADKTGQIAHANGQMQYLGDAQASEFILRLDQNPHANATWYDLTLTGAAAAAATVIKLATCSVMAFDAMITGAKTDGSKTFAYRIVGAIQKIGSATALLGTPTITTLGEGGASADTQYDARAVADDTLDALLIQVTSGTTNGDRVKWSAVVRTVEVNYA